MVNDTQAEQEMVVFWKSGTTSALYKQIIAESRDVGSSAVFSRNLNGQILTFAANGDTFTDQE